MLSSKVKKFLSGIMISGDLLLGAVFFADLLSGTDISIDLFMLAFLGADALLSLDYISRLSKEEELKKKQESSRRYEKPERRLDREMAEDISSSHEVLEMDPEELAELLQNHAEEDEEVLRR